ncbi:MAG TPA: hypothetical protein VIK33_02095 [Anaerolineae bacterium]
MRGLLLLALIVLIVYVLYTNGTLNQLIPGLPDPNSTPEIVITVREPNSSRTTITPAPDAMTLQPTIIIAPPMVTIETPATAPLDTLTPTPLPAQPTVPPPTIITFEPAPTLAASTTPTPASNFPLKIETPLDGETLQASPWLVIGETQPNALVSVNDVIGFANAEGRFALSVPLTEGPNVLEIIASNTVGEQVFVIVTVLYQP